MIDLDAQICSDFDQSTQREWLETNGLGGFASSTLSGINTRRYHGLLVAATDPPTGRMVLLSKLEETLVLDGERFELSANAYSGAVHPQGYQYLSAFRLDPFPVFTYDVGGVLLVKTIAMVHGENTTIVKWQLVGGKDGVSASLEIRPLIAFRDYHSLTHENPGLDPTYSAANGCMRLQPYAGLPELYLANNAAEIASTGEWYRRFQYSQEQARGLDFEEDLFQPMLLLFNLTPETPAYVIVSTSPKSTVSANKYLRNEKSRRQKLVETAPGGIELVPTLLRAADQFIVDRGDGQTIIAGYPWFTDWGRDTMIALPGLSLAAGRPEIARSIILEFAKYIDQGMLPNRFPDKEAEPEYNTLDATLWYFEAIRAYLQHTGDYELVSGSLYSRLQDIINWHVKGTRYGIRVDGDGLLNSGAEGVQLTWMDARVGDWVVTPRRGKPVEIQALWYNALQFMGELAAKFGDPCSEKLYASMAARAKSSFSDRFWNEDAGCLYDVIDGEIADASIRPNQVLAISLHHAILDSGRAGQVLKVVERDLMTPFGLRTLAPSDPRYISHYRGGPLERDGAYHQGTVWAWLMGPYITAYLKTFGRDMYMRRQVQAWLAGFELHLREAGVGQISEIFDGDPPHAPNGCIAQAWSVGELLRAIVQDVLPEQESTD